MIPQRTEIYDTYRPVNASERALIRWLDSYGVNVVRATPLAPPALDTTEADLSLGRVVIERGESTRALFHEAVHIWLSASGLSPEYLVRLPEALGQRGMAYEYRKLSSLISAMLDAEERLGAADLLALRAVLGPPEAYGTFRSENGNFRREAFSATMAGNLVDETITLGRPRAHGHPMEDFHEFFASAMTTLAYDGSTFFTNLRGLERLSNSHPGTRMLFEQALAALAQVHSYGRSLSEELRHSGFANSARLEANLSRLERFLDSRRSERESI